MLIPLIKSLTKAQKRNFKLFANRSGGSGNAKFVTLFDAVETIGEWDEAKILRRCPDIRREQLPNMKAHLYRQVLISLSLLTTSHNAFIEIREMIAFARILYDKSLFGQCLRMLDKAKTLAITVQNYTLTLEIVEFEKRVETLHMTRSAINRAELLSRQADSLTAKIRNINSLSNISIQLYNLNLKLGYMRSEKDRKMIVAYFHRRLQGFDASMMDFHEKLYLYQSHMWYSYIQHDFLHCYRWARAWVDLFDGNEDFKVSYYDHYIRGCSRLMDVMFMTRQITPLKNLIAQLEHENVLFTPQNTNAIIMQELALLFAKINVHFMEGSFAQGVELASRVDGFIEQWGDYLDEHYKMQLYYKVACLYFGNEQYLLCIKYLQKIISVRNPQFRRDLQCFARILNLIASYEAGEDLTLDQQIKSVYAFVVKMNDMHAVQMAIINFLRRLPRTYASDFRGELIKLHAELKPLEKHPYQRRPFFYLDIISWLESKISGAPISEIIQSRFVASR